MTKILVITNKDDPHTDYVLPKMEEHGLDVYRLNTEDISKAFDLTLNLENLHQSHINFHISGKLFLDDVNGVWYRRPIQPKLNTIQEKYRSITKNEISHSFQGLYTCLDSECLWVNDPFFIRRSENKIYQIKVVHNLGFLVPKSCITQDPKIALDFIKNCPNGAIVKSLSGETLKDEDGIKAVYTHLLNEKDLENLSEIKNCPTFFQEHIEKDTELRITVVGEQVFAISINTQESEDSKNDWRRGITSGKLKYSLYPLPEYIKHFCIQLTRSLGLNFGAIDMIKNKKGDYVFLEINPNGQWLWLEIETGAMISNALINLFCSKTSND